MLAGAPRGQGQPRAAASLVVLAAASFVYVTAETFPVGLLPQLSRGLHVTHGSIGLLVTVYAAVAGLAAVPMTAWTSYLPRRLLVMAALGLLAASQLVIAVAPDYATVLVARLVCALGHGVFWALLAPVAASLVAPERAGRATAVVFAGNSLALVLGSPLATAIGQLLGWRAAAALVGAAALVTTGALLAVLPPIPSGTSRGSTWVRIQSVGGLLRRRSLLGLCAVTVLVVTGHFTVYTYIADLARRDAGITGLLLSGLLLAYGAAALLGNGVVALLIDRRPRLVSLSSTAGMTLALALLAVIGPGSRAGTIVAVLLWGAAFEAVPTCMQSGILRAAPDAPDTASALLVVAFQIGIGGGALAGALLVGLRALGDLPVVGMLLAAAATVLAARGRAAFPSRLAAPVRAPSAPLP